MRRFVLACAVLWSVGSTSLPATGAEPPLQCNTGPIAKTYGKTPWLVYSCDDDRTVVIVAAAGSPDAPFYFVFSQQGSGYRLSGEGTGRKDATNAAFDDLKTLSEREIVALIEQTKAH